MDSDVDSNANNNMSSDVDNDVDSNVDNNMDSDVDNNMDSDVDNNMDSDVDNDVNNDWYLSDKPLSEDEIRHLRSELPKALTEGSLEDVRNLIQTRACLDLKVDYDGDDFPRADYSTTKIPLLHLASAYGTLEIVKFLLDSGANVEETTDAGSTVLHLAARKGRTEILTILLQRGAIPLLNQPTEEDWCPLHEAAWDGHLETCRLLLKNGANVNLKGKGGRTALMEAASEEHRDIIELLLDANADIDDMHNRKWTALHYAAAMNRRQSIKLLLDRGADMTMQDGEWGTALHVAAGKGSGDAAIELLSHPRNTFIDTENGHGNTALNIAAMKGQPHIVQMLIDRGADKNIVDDKKSTALHLACLWGRLHVSKILITEGAALDEYNCFGVTPLQYAAGNGFDEIVSILLEHGAKVDKNDQYGNTSMQLACDGGHHKVVEILLGYNAAVGALSKQNRWTPLQTASNKGHTKVISLLLAHKADVTVSDVEAWTALHLACAKGHKDAARMLLESHADLNSQTVERQTPLHVAACGGHLEIVKLLLDRGAQIDLDDVNGNTPLHGACLNNETTVIEFLIIRGADMHKPNNQGHSAFYDACLASNIQPLMPLLKAQHSLLRTDSCGRSVLHYACSNGRHSTVKALLQDGKLDPSLPSQEGFSALRLAIDKGHVEIVLNLLNCQQYYPATPIGSNPCSIPEHEAQIIADGLDQILCREGHISADGVNAILYWAIANNKSHLIDKLFTLYPGEPPRLKRGMTCLHVAAQYGRTELVEQYFGHMDSMQSTEDGVTCLQIATACGHLDLVITLLDRLSHSPHKQIEAIIKLNDSQESLLSLAVNRRDPEMKRVVWDKLEALAMNKRDFYLSNKGQAERILELAAQFEKPGLEIYLWKMFESWFEKPRLNHQRFTVLHLAIYHRQVVVLWWVLSNGGHFKNDEIDFAHEMLRGKNDTLSLKMLGLLQNPPQIVEQAAITDSDRPPMHPKMSSSVSALKDLPITIIDFYDKDNGIDLHYTKRGVGEIIYDPKRGPKEVMESARKSEYRQLKFLKQELAELTEKESESPRHAQHENDRHHVESDHHADIGNIRFRWIHVPVNHMQLTTDLATVLSIEQGRTEKEHRHFATFFSRSCKRVAAGQGKAYMKPQCMQEFIEQTPTWDSSKESNESYPPPKRGKLALYMPFLSLGKTILESEEGHKQTRKGINPQQYRSRKNDTRSLETVPHEPMTLDQYFYPTLENTHERDNSQVVSRYLERMAKPKEQDKRSIAADRNTNGIGITSPEASPKTILMVDQLWMWVMDGSPGTIITTSTKSPDQSEDILSAGIHDLVISSQRKSSLERVASVDSMIEVVLGVATGLFMERNLLTQNVSTEDKEEKKSALEIFRESIRHVADKETILFKDFLKSLEDEMNNSSHRSWQGWINDMPKNPYHVIDEEARLLYEIKDIHDELNMLRTLAENQQHVWEQVFQTKQLDSFKNFQFNDVCTPSMVLRDIQDMITETETVQDSINTLLDLRQKQASIKEAEFGRQQASDTAKQANIVLVFTIVTIVFLPLSFLCSLFALNVKDFPHASGTVEYHGWWLFPILFGVSAAVSIPFIVLAFNFDRAIRLWDWIKHGGRENNNSNTTPSRPSRSRKFKAQEVEMENLSTLDEYSQHQKSILGLRKYALRRHQPLHNPC